MNRLPSDDEILAFLRDNPGQSGKREIARAFGLKGAAKVELKQTLARLARDGAIEKRRRHVRPAGALPPVLVLRVTGPDAAGDLWAEPAEWETDAPAPRILVRTRRDDPALGAGDRLLGRLLDGEETLTARVIRRIGMGPRRVLGIFHDTAEGGRIAAIDKKTDRDWLVARGDAGGARDGELVEAEQTGPARGHGLPRARVVARLGDPSAPRSVSLIAIHEHGIPDAFPEDTLTDAAAAKPIRALGTREDLRALPFVTIDPSDARDHDDAVLAHADDAPDNPGGHVVWVAIADVAHYVTPGSALDREARRRGNSTYFPDRVVPMLPDRLSGDLCSLVDGRDRPAIAVRLTLDAAGQVRAHRFTRALIRSAATLTYSQAQAAADGTPRRHHRAAPRHRHHPALGRMGSGARGARPAPAAEPRPPRAPHRPRRRRQGAFRRLPRAPRRPPADRGLHDPRQRRRRRDAGGEAPAPALPRPRGTLPREARGAARDRRLGRPHAGERPGPQDRPPQPPARRRRRHRARRDGQHQRPALDDPSLLRARRTSATSASTCRATATSPRRSAATPTSSSTAP